MQSLDADSVEPFGMSVRTTLRKRDLTNQTSSGTKSQLADESFGGRVIWWKSQEEPVSGGVIWQESQLAEEVVGGTLI